MAATEETVSGSLGLLLGLSGALLQGAKREAEGEKLEHASLQFQHFYTFHGAQNSDLVSLCSNEFRFYFL